MSLDARFKRLAMEEDDEDCGGDGSHGHSHAAAGQHGHSHGGGHGHSHGGAPCHGHSHSGSSHGHSHGGGGHGHGHSHGPGQMCYGHHGDEEEDEEELMMQAAAQNYIVSNKFDDKAKYAIDFDAASGRIEMDGVAYEEYRDERQMPLIMDLITRDLSEPYSIYTYRYFIHNWPYLCFLAMDDQKCVGSIVCKLDRYKETMRGYIAMLAVHQDYRRKKIGSNLVSLAIKRMIQHDADEVVLETEITNKSALKLYENLGFVKDKRLFRYYLNGVEAFRLKLWLK